ncbi:phospholipase [Micromonospora sp. CPCC 205371]|nr:phospholipase [Micromonospora sp. CPCC 205371]
MTSAHTHTHAHTLDDSMAGSVMLNIGADVGALIITTGPEWHGHEIEISRKGDVPEVRTHVAVRARKVSGGVRYTAVFPSLPAGAYVIWRNETEPAGTVVVAGATVTEIEWWPQP